MYVSMFFDMNSMTHFFHDWSWLVIHASNCCSLLPNRQESHRPIPERPSPERYGSDHPRGRHRATHGTGHLHPFASDSGDFYVQSHGLFGLIVSN